MPTFPLHVLPRSASVPLHMETGSWCWDLPLCFVEPTQSLGCDFLCGHPGPSSSWRDVQCLCVWLGHFPTRAEDQQFISTAPPSSLAENWPSLHAGDCTMFLGCICSCHLQSGHSYSRVKGLYLLHWNRKLRVSEIKKNTYQQWSGSEKRASFGKESLISGSSPYKLRLILPTLGISLRVRDIDRKCPA